MIPPSNFGHPVPDAGYWGNSGKRLGWEVGRFRQVRRVRQVGLIGLTILVGVGGSFLEVNAKADVDLATGEVVGDGILNVVHVGDPVIGADV